MIAPKVTQMVVEFKLINQNRFFNMRKIADNTSDVIFDPNTFPGIRLKIRETRASVNFFSNGFGRIFGNKSMNDIDKSIHILRKKLHFCGYRTRVIEKKLISICATTCLNQRIRKLPEAVKGLKGLISEKFSGGTVYVNNITAILFHTGTINYFSAKNFEQIVETNNFLIKYFLNNNLIKNE